MKKHKDANGDPERKHYKFRLVSITREINELGEEQIEESPESILEWYNKKIHLNDYGNCVDFIFTLIMAECWLYDHFYIKELNEPLNEKFKKLCPKKY